MLLATRGLSARPALNTLRPSKKIHNRLLFDFDSRLPRKKVLPVLQEIYSNLDNPQLIRLPSSINGSDLMVQKHILATLRRRTTVNKYLMDLENELVEQAAELGDNDAITLLAFEALRNEKPTSEDFKTAQLLIKELAQKKHPLVIKMTGDLAWERKKYREAAAYWKQFLLVENDTILASQVLLLLGVFYFQYEPNLALSREYFSRCIATGDLDHSTVMAHFYLGQIYTATDPELARYHLEVAAGTALRESFAPLGFLEMNVFRNNDKAIEWFKLGAEIGDLQCVVGLFDCNYLMGDYKAARRAVERIEMVRLAIFNANKTKVNAVLEGQMATNAAIIKTFLSTRSAEVKKVTA